MKHSMEVGFNFGATSGIITTLGLLVGLNASTHSKSVVIGGILTIALADAFSDALGIHMSEEAENIHTSKQVWVATLFTFISKFIAAITFVVPILFLDLSKAVWVSVFWGFSVLSVISYGMARKREVNPLKVISEHLLITGLVVILTHNLGIWISVRF
ncbi:MAG: hypothetical protein KAI70_02160 [Candidatus Omnitrophica bacterium]|nr:hypothetical protein [Candidatus Omnitrophota bacterium]